jgi:hypothetical protein
MTSVYDAILEDVEIMRRKGGYGGSASVGNPAIRLDQPNAASEYAYTQDQFNKGDVINVGVGGTFSVPAATSVQIPTPNISNPFKAEKVTIPSSVAEFLLLQQVTIGATNLIDGDAICADIFSEVSLNNCVSWPTAQTGQQFRVQIQNADAVNAHQPRLTLTGIRLRP